jgi:hypothetical protein
VIPVIANISAAPVEKIAAGDMGGNIPTGAFMLK